jgi:hypothetical protein
VPAWTHLSLIGAVPLHAQQSKASSSSDADSDSDSDSDDDDDHDAATAVLPHGHGSVRTVEIARTLHAARDTGALLHVDVSYATGSLSVSPVDGPWLYDVRVSYRPQTSMPRVSFDSAGHALHVSGSKNGDIQFTFGDHNSHADDDLHVALGRKVPLDLSIVFGGGDVTAQLGGLSIQRLKLHAGAADAHLAFNDPDPIPLDDLDLKIGAAGFQATGLGNAHVRHMTVQAAAGDIDLDFGGRWTGDATVSIEAALGAVHVHVPRNVEVDQHNSKVVIGSMGDGPGPATAETPGGPIYHLRLTSTTSLGSIDFDRKTRE